MKGRGAHGYVKFLGRIRWRGELIAFRMEQLRVVRSSGGSCQFSMVISSSLSSSKPTIRSSAFSFTFGEGWFVFVSSTVEEKGHSFSGGLLEGDD